jgi:Family of unknown function (DUF5677)
LNVTVQAQLFFGNLDAAAEFEKRHPLWPDRFMNLVRAIDMAFTRVQTMSEPAEKLIYFYGRMCAEDFMEVLLVCGNGYGEAGLKLLRCLYEHTVTLRYLHEHPNEADLFMDFHHVQQHKLMRNILDGFGKDALQPEAQNERFKVDGLEEQLQTCLRDSVEIWMPNSDLLKDVGGA